MEQLAWPAVKLPRVVAVSLLALFTMFLTLPKEPWREMVAQLHDAAGSADIVLIEASWMTMPFDHYDQGVMVRSALGPSDLGPQLAERLRAYQRAWLVLASAEMIDPQGQVLEWFMARFAVNRRWDYYHLQVWEFEIPR